jgi:hypothetical protein
MAKKMVGVLTDVSQLDHSKYNALIVCILSHGNENVVYASCDTSVRTPTIFFAIKSGCIFVWNPSLSKVFFNLPTK